MYCPNCGTKNKDDARFCANCGQKLEEETVQETPVQEQPVQKEPSYNHQEQPNKTKKPSSKSFIIILACVIVAVVGIFGYQYFKNKKDNTATTAKKQDTATTQDTSSKNTEAVDEKDDEEGEDQASHALPYTDNKQMNLTASTKTSDYTTVTSKDKSFSFAYPKHLFNFSDIDEEDGYTEYTLGYVKDGEDEPEITVEIGTEEASYSDPVENVKDVYNDKKSDLYTVSFDYPSGGKTPKVNNGKTSMIVMGYKDYAQTQCEYVLVTSDGKKNYIMEVEYKDSDSSNEYKEINYVLDCLYRGCSFTNSTYKMRNFAQFKKDDMGTKK